MSKPRDRKALRLLPRTHAEHLVLVPLGRRTTDCGVRVDPLPDVALAVEAGLELALAGEVAHRSEQVRDGLVLPAVALVAVPHRCGSVPVAEAIDELCLQREV